MTRIAVLLLGLLMAGCKPSIPSQLQGTWSTGDCGPNHLAEMIITADGITTMYNGKVITSRRNAKFGETRRTVYIEFPDDPNPWLRYAYLKPLGERQILQVTADFSRADDASADNEVPTDPLTLTRCD